MEWTECICRALRYIEENLTEGLTIGEIAKRAAMSPFYFQKGFAMLCGFTVGEYIKKRRLTLAGSELVFTNVKVIDLAIKYGYDSPDSFTKAFTRFHGATPTAVRKGEAIVKSFAPLKIQLILDGGYMMDYRILEKEQFTIAGMSKAFRYEEAAVEIPKFWAEYFQTVKDDMICSVYGVSIDEKMDGNEFEYLIADNYNPTRDVPGGFATRVIPKHTWAVFPCKGASSHSIQDVHKKIFSEWLPNCKEYKIAAGFHIEMYSDPAGYAEGIQDKEYYCEIWIPVRRK